MACLRPRQAAVSHKNTARFHTSLVGIANDAAPDTNPAPKKKAITDTTGTMVIMAITSVKMARAKCRSRPWHKSRFFTALPMWLKLLLARAGSQRHTLHDQLHIEGAPSFT